MSRSNARLLGGLFTVLAGIGAMILGKKAGQSVAKAASSEPPPPPALTEQTGEATEEVEGKPA